ncbi:hypothetical protein HDV00_012161 [Rhizophlyctis rosea]|nr:hypothetical protein HDV00_012161 [Rhizophlyctis rosea]
MDALTTEFATTYLDKKPELKECGVDLQHFRNHMERVVTLAGFDCGDDEEQGGSGTFFQETTLYLYRGNKRPWWTSPVWFWVWSVLYMGLFWEFCVEYRGYGVKKLIVRRALF